LEHVLIGEPAPTSPGHALVASFFVLADRARKTANILFREGQMEDAALNVQQLVERVARGLMTHEGIPFGTSHNLGQMANALPADHPFRDRIKGFDDLSAAVTAFDIRPIPED
jgi:HEPN domain-containing protein